MKSCKNGDPVITVNFEECLLTWQVLIVFNTRGFFN